MATFDSEVDLPYDAARLKASPLSWIARDSCKPDRPGTEAWVLHSAPEWATDHLEAEPVQAAALLLDAFRDATGCAETPAWMAAHRWMYARVLEPAGQAALFDVSLALGACGDWCLGDRVEAAWLSGASLAARVLAGDGAPRSMANSREDPGSGGG
jgi:predicted NAD/FAD-dependent oxidoreductase